MFFKYIISLLRKLMSKIKLPETSGLNTLRINDNFQKIEDELNDKVLYRDNPSGEPNEMHNDLDMNSNRIYNLPAPIAEHEPLRLKEASDVISATEDAKDATNKANDAADRADAAADNAINTVDRMEKQFEADQADRSSRFDSDQSDRDARFNAFIASSGYQFLGDYKAGIKFTEYNQIVRDNDGEFWRLSGKVKLPYTTTGAGLPENDSLTPLGDAVLRQDLANPNVPGLGADLVADTARYVNVVDRGARDGYNSQTAIQTAVDEALSKGLSVWWPAGTYISSENINNFHDVKHYGEGRIQRNDYIWHISPKWNDSINYDVNELHVASGGLITNDGLSPSESTTIAGSLGVPRLSGKIGRWGHATISGVWRVRIHGHISFNGIRCYDLPYFSRPLEIFGEDVADETVDEPITVWDGGTATEPNAIRMEHSGLSLMSVHVKNIKFINWTGEAMVLETTGKASADNCWAENCGSLVSYRSCNVSHFYGSIKNCNTGITAGYHARGRVDSVIFQGNSHDITITRISVFNVRNCTHKDTVRRCLRVHKNSRVRSQGNRYENFGEFAVIVQQNSIYDYQIGTPPNVFVGASSVKLPIKIESNSIDHTFSSGVTSAQSFNHRNIISNKENERVLVNSLSGMGAPFRLGGYSLLNPDFYMEVKVFGRFQTGAGALFELSDGPGPNNVLADVNFASSPGSRGFILTFHVSGCEPVLGKPRSFAELSVHSLGSTIYTKTYEGTGLVNPDGAIDVEVLGRLYVTPKTNDEITIERIITTVRP